MLIYDDFSVTSHSKSFDCLFESFLSDLVCVPSFMSMNGSALSRTKYDRDNFNPTPCKQL